MMTSSKEQKFATISKSFDHSAAIHASILDLENGKISDVQDFLTSCAAYKNSNDEQIEYLRRDVDYFTQTYEHDLKQPLDEFKQDLINETTTSIKMLSETVSRLKNRINLIQPMIEQIKQWNPVNQSGAEFQNDVITYLDNEILRSTDAINRHTLAIKMHQQNLKDYENDEYIKQRYESNLVLLETRLQEVKDTLDEATAKTLDCQKLSLDLAEQITNTFVDSEHENDETER